MKYGKVGNMSKSEMKKWHARANKDPRADRGIGIRGGYICLKDCSNRDIKCNGCIRFSEFKETA